jgi:hypothetical protein
MRFESALYAAGQVIAPFRRTNTADEMRMMANIGSPQAGA